MAAGRCGTTAMEQWVLIIIGWVFMGVFMDSSAVSAVPPMDTAFSLPPGMPYPLNNCTGKHCQIILQRIAVIRQAVLDKIQSKLSPKDTHATVRQPVNRPTAQPKIANTPSPLLLFEEIVTFAEQPDLPDVGLPDENIVKFKIANPKAERRLEVKRAELWILVRMKHGRSSSRRKRPRAFGKRPRAFGKRRGRRVHLKIFTLKEPNSRKSRDVKASRAGEILTEVRLQVQKSQWQKFGMPLNLIQRMLDDPSKSLSLRVDCEGCGKKVSPVLLYKNGRKKRSKRKRRRSRRKRKLSKKRPLLVIHTGVKSRPEMPT